MNILITGSKGQLGKSIEKFSPNFGQYKFTYTDFEELDITNYKQLKKFISANEFNVIINCAGYTAVDKAEEEPEKARLLNATAPGYLAKLASEFDITLIHISTDYIFDGKINRPYIESDIPEPLSIYAKTKVEGENQVDANAKKAVIFRTSWLYSEFGNNFVKTIIRLANERDVLNIIDDQVGSPTYASDLAETILKILPELIKINGTEIYHYSNLGKASWYDFAKEIISISELKCKVNPIETKDYPLPAARPHYSLMDKQKIINTFGIQIPNWKDSLKICL
ncbi:MAG: dTDP-4-dehydrorhamnose reductase, partial [Bacteroidales bacterium]|nr:dTDP-4-dehydrorhamnose reductase [Bacteroidales bacterium]